MQAFSFSSLFLSPLFSKQPCTTFVTADFANETKPIREPVTIDVTMGAQRVYGYTTSKQQPPPLSQRSRTGDVYRRFSASWSGSTDVRVQRHITACGFARFAPRHGKPSDRRSCSFMLRVAGSSS